MSYAQAMKWHKKHVKGIKPQPLAFNQPKDDNTMPKYKGFVVDRITGILIYESRWTTTVESASHRAERAAPKGPRRRATDTP